MTTKFSDLLNLCFRHTRALLIFWMVTIVCVLVFYTQTEKSYDSKARILVSMGAEAQGKAEYLDGKNLVLTQREEQVYDEQQILQSHEVALLTAKWILGDSTTVAPPAELAPRIEEARRYFTGQVPQPTLLLRAGHAVLKIVTDLTSKPKTHEQQVEELALSISKRLSVNAIFNSDALDIAYRYRDPRVAQTVLKLVLAAYIDHHIAVFQDPGEQNLLKSQLDQSINQYQDRLSELSAYMVAHHVYTGDAQVDSMIDQGEKLEQSYSEAAADSEAQAARLRLLNTLSGSMEKYERYSSTEVRNKEREELATKLNDELIQEQNVLNLHPKGSRAYLDEQARLDRLRELIKHQPDQVLDQTEQRRNSASQLVESDIVDATSAQRADQARMQQLHAERSQIGSQINNYANSVGGFNLLKLQIDFAKQKSEQLGHAYVDSQLKSLTSQSAITDVSIVDPPSWDWHTASPKPSLIAVAALGLLLIGSVAVLLACIALDDTFIDGKVATGALHAPVVATFPLAQEHNASTILAADSEQEFARLYQAVRDDDPDGRVVLLTSAGGASASDSGLAFARFLRRMTGRPTSFVDCSSTGHPVTEASDAPSILSWPAPSPDHNGAEAEALASITAWRQEFAYTVLAADADHLPVNLLSASHLIHSTFLVLDANQTRRGEAFRDLELLRTCGFPKIKLVLNQFRSFTPSWIARFV